MRRSNLKIFDIDVGFMIPRVKTALDLGCGEGGTLKSLKSAGIVCCGVDVSVELLKKARLSANSDGMWFHLAMADAEALPIRDASMDLIVCAEVIEHLHNPDFALREIKRILKSGGFLLLSFPVPFVERIIQRINARFVQFSGHVHQFELKEMVALLEKHDLKVRFTYRKYFEWSIYWFLRAVFNKIPSTNRTGKHYGLEDAYADELSSFDRIYRRIWRLARRLMIGELLLSLGNLMFPKSYCLICEKT